MPFFFRAPIRVRSRIPRRAYPYSTGFVTTTLVLDVVTVSFTGQSIAFTFTQAVDVGSLTFAGQAIDLTRIMPLSVGSLSFSGQAHTFTFGLGVTAGAISFTGQSVSLLDLSPSSASRAPLFLAARAGRLASIWKGTRG